MRPAGTAMSTREPASLDLRSDRGADAHAPESQSFAIREVASRFQLTYRALRFYESKGLIRPRHEDGQRFYGEEDLSRLELVVWGKRMGFSLAEIARLIEDRARGAADAPQGLLQRGEMQKRLQDLTDRRDEISAAIDELKRHLAEFD